MTFGEKVIAFHEQLLYTGNPLPKGVSVTENYMAHYERTEKP